MDLLNNIWFWVDASVFSLMLFLIIYLVFRNIVWRKRYSEGSVEYLKISVESNAKISALVKELEKRDNSALQQSDGFVKFLSESRDWAFKYIEDVQEALSEFEKEVEPVLKYHNKYGQVLGSTVFTEQLDKISLAYDNLKTVMPESTNNNDPEPTVQDKEKQ